MTPERLAEIVKSLKFRWATTSETRELISHIESLQQQIAERDEEIRIKGAILIGNMARITELPKSRYEVCEEWEEHSNRMKAALLRAAEIFDGHGCIESELFESHAKRCRDAAEEGR